VRIPAFRPFFFLALLFVLPDTRAFAAGTGVVVDASGRAVPRATVRITSRNGEPVATVFSSADGTFEIPSRAPADCAIEVALPGFETSRTRCAASGAVRIALTVAPVKETLVVSATRGEAPSAQVASSVTVLDAEEIDRRQAPLVADLLRTVPGVAVVRNGAVGNVTSLFIRGGESNYTKVLLDGIPLNEPGGVYNFSNVTSEHLDRIEVVRGAQSALFGSDAMAGVIQMFTRRGLPGPPRVIARLEGGSYDTVRGSAGVSGLAGGLDYSLHAARLQTDNREPNNSFTNTTLSGTAGVELGARSSLRVVARGELGRTGVPGAAAFGRPDLDASFRRRDGVVGITFTQRTAGSFRHVMTYALTTTRQESVNRLIDPPYTPRFEDHVGAFEFSDFAYDLHNSLHRHHAAYQADLQLFAGRRAGTHLSTAAVEWDGERATLTDRLAASSTRASRDNFGTTLQHQILWPQVFVTAGVRVERNESFGVSAVPRGSVAWMVRKGDGRVGATKLRVSAGRGIKEPTVLQSFSTSPFFLGNPDLEPETSRSIDAGIEQRGWNDRAKVELAWFDSRYRSIISTRTISFSPFMSQYFNIGLTRARGVELAGEVMPLGGFRVRGGYTLLKSRIIESTAPTSAVFREGQWLFRRPRHSGYAQINATRGRVTADLIGTFVGRAVDSDFAELQPPLLWNDPRATWDVRGSYRVSRRSSVFLAIDNLTGAEYMEPLGYRALGRALRGGLQAGF
jgi:vitamin B12 transporter